MSTRVERSVDPNAQRRSRGQLLPSRRVATPRTRSKVDSHLATLGAARARGGVSRRKAQGAHYTPPALVRFVLEESLHGWKPGTEACRVLDPACGSGNFLVEAARVLAHRDGVAVARILRERVFGVDIDPVAVKLARAALLELLPPRTSEPTRRAVSRALARNIAVGDALAMPPDRRFELIVGNPPFLNQLEKGTAASRARARMIAEVTGGAVRRYTDLAAAFLLWGLARLAPRGRLGFVMPQSFLATGDARSARDAAVGLARLRSIWSCEEPLFEDANVRVCTLVFEQGGVVQRRGGVQTRGGDRGGLRRAFGAEFAALRGSTPRPQAGDESWASMLSEGFGAPRITLDPSGRCIADIATATADFRDQYYGLAGAVVENGAGPRLATTRHIGLAECAWGACTARILGERYERPTIEVDRLAGRKGMERWLAARLVPKVLVATQTKVIEAFVDEQGEYAPLVPLITVVPRDGTDLWLLAAAIASPIVAVRARSLYAGSALGAGAIKLSAKQLLAMPLPLDRTAWNRSAELLRARDLPGFARSSCEAHALSPRETRDVLHFWTSRL